MSGEKDKGASFLTGSPSGQFRLLRYFTDTALAAVLFIGLAQSAGAASYSFTFSPRIVVQADCRIIKVRKLKFGTHGLLTNNVDVRRRLRIRCTKGTPFDIGLDAGTGAGATTSVRKMSNGGATIDYGMYKNKARTKNWGNTIGVDTKSGTGTGKNQNFSIYGRVPPQTTPAPGTYVDTITVTITY